MLLDTTDTVCYTRSRWFLLKDQPSTAPAVISRAEPLKRSSFRWGGALYLFLFAAFVRFSFTLSGSAANPPAFFFVASSNSCTTAELISPRLALACMARCCDLLA